MRLLSSAGSITTHQGVCSHPTVLSWCVCRALFAFLVWSLGLHALLALHQRLIQQRLQLDRLGVEGLILTTNNTGEFASQSAVSNDSGSSSIGLAGARLAGSQKASP